MGKKYSLWLWRKSRKGLIAVLVALSLAFITVLSTFANTVNISDRAGILDVNRVRNEASSLPNRLDIYTTGNFNGSVTNFNQNAIRSIPNPNAIVMAISTNLHYVSIVGGRDVGLSNDQYTEASNSFINTYRSTHNYTSATIAAIDSLRSALGGSSSGNVVPGAGGSIFGGTLCCVGLLIIVGIVFFAFVRRRSGRGFFNRQRYDSTSNQPFNQPYNQPGYPPNYGPGNPPNQGGGMNPWAAGGLGAAAGGLFGYELGKQAGERDRDGDGDNLGGGDFGGGAGGSFGSDGGDFGGGAGGNFGGDNGDLGGGAGGSFGGDGGGGGFDGDNSGGGDFGGGAGGNF